jgi:hypothetical protein
MEDAVELGGPVQTLGHLVFDRDLDVRAYANTVRQALTREVDRRLLHTQDFADERTECRRRAGESA